MRIPSFAGVLIMSIGVALMYIGLHDWAPNYPLFFPKITPIPASGGGGGGFG